MTLSKSMGGTLDLIATFPESGPVKIVNIGDLDHAEEEETQEHLATAS